MTHTEDPAQTGTGDRTTTAQVAGAVADIRDLVETRLWFGYAGSRSLRTLGPALDILRSAPIPVALRATVTDLITHLDRLFRDGLSDGADLDRASALTAAVLDAIRVPGLPHPTDPDWTFEGPDQPQDPR
jgi:hypothetical protein